MLRRPLSPEERGALLGRQNQIWPWTIGFHPQEADAVASNLGKMFNAFPHMANYSDEAAVAKIKQASETLSRFPAWAIERVCERVRLRGYTRKDGDRYVQERHWAPADPELVDMIEAEVSSYTRALHSARDLLDAEVQP